MDRLNEWQAFFDSFAAQYEEEVYTRATQDELKFLNELLNLPPGANILDMGCGTGRHTVGLAQMGYRVTGVDISEGMLEQARLSGNRAGDEVAQKIHLVYSDAANFEAEAEFDAAICLCEGALCLLGAVDDPFDRDVQILKNICRALKPGGIFVTTVLSAMRVIRQHNDEDVAAGRFDPIYLVETSVLERELSGGGVAAVNIRERVYTPAEFARMLRQAGFEALNIWGGTAGKWGKRALEMDEYEFMVVARRLQT